MVIRGPLVQYVVKLGFLCDPLLFGCFSQENNLSFELIQNQLGKKVVRLCILFGIIDRFDTWLQIVFTKSVVVLYRVEDEKHAR